LIAQGQEAISCLRGHAPILVVGNHLQELLQTEATDPGDDPELSKVSPERIDQHGSLADQQMTRPVQHQDRLLVGRLHRNKAHGGPCHRLADRLGIRRVALAPLYVELDIGRRHQPHLVPQSLKRARPEVARAARFHTNQTRLQLANEGYHLAPA
jgi:hypothetical protein